MASRFSPRPAQDDGRYLIVPCEADASLAVIWDCREEQVVDVIDAAARRYSYEDALWDEGRRGRYEPLRWAA
jgi:hypothetical protein